MGKNRANLELQGSVNPRPRSRPLATSFHDDRKAVSVGAMGVSGQGAAIRGASYWVLTVDGALSSP